MEMRAVIAAVKLRRSAWVCAVERAAASALGGMLIPALRLLVVAGFLFFETFLVDGQTVRRLTDRRSDG